MKLSLNVLQKFMLLFCLGMFVVGCSNDILSENNKQSKTEFLTYGIKSESERITTADLKFVGIEHNAYLEIVYNELVDSGVEGQEALDLVKITMIDEIQNSRYTDECKDLAIQIIEEYPLNPTPVYDNLYPNEEVEAALSDEEKSYLNQLQVIILDEEASLENRQDRIGILEDEISIMEFTDKQFITLYSATNVAKYSLKYWSLNLEKWDNLDNKEHWNDDMEDIVEADVGGAVTAAVYTWAANAVPGAGQVAYGGAIVSGAALASAGAALGNIVSGWFD